MNHKNLFILEKMPIKKAVITLIVPTILSMMVQVFYNLTDTFFIGKLNDPYQVAAVTITMPLFMMLMALSGIFGNGAASYISRLLGQKRYKDARSTSSLALFCITIMGLLISIFANIYIKHILDAVGTSPNTYEYCRKYLAIILYGAIPIMLNFAMSQLLRSEGNAKIVFIGMIVGTGANIILDPIFIFVLKQGVVGAAVATVIGNVLSLLYYIYYYLKFKGLATPSFRYIRFKSEYFKEILKIGLPTSLSQLMMSVGSSISYKLASNYGDHALAAMGVSQRVISIVIFTFIGLANGIQPLIGYSYGAGNTKRLRDSISFSTRLGLSLAVVFVLSFLFFSKYAVIIFINDEQVIEFGSKMLLVFTAAIPFAVLQMIYMVTLQAMGKAIPSLIVSLSRQGLIYIPLVLILNKYFQFDGLIWAMPITDILTSIIAFLFFYPLIYKIDHSIKE
ncbi:MAG TPA: MATE family efflux transporter [Candidatus Cloacimonadota bacterium]|jgi:putative MATE family efflux protein|nr:MATE family efflux transporter [Candidatus Cloacimonadota bacterium]HQB41737.1 MATE family efflux transporter [Candidatus Cloacimonadota bacterium]